MYGTPQPGMPWPSYTVSTCFWRSLAMEMARRTRTSLRASGIRVPEGKDPANSRVCLLVLVPSAAPMLGVGAALGTSTSKHTLEFAGSFPSGTRIPEARNDVRVRRAISMANDRQKQVDTVYEGHGIPGWGVPYIYYQDTMPTAAQL